MANVIKIVGLSLARGHANDFLSIFFLYFSFNEENRELHFKSISSSMTSTKFPLNYVCSSLFDDNRRSARLSKLKKPIFEAHELIRKISIFSRIKLFAFLQTNKTKRENWSNNYKHNKMSIFCMSLSLFISKFI